MRRLQSSGWGIRAFWAALVIAISAGPVAAGEIQSIVSFGDSLSDVGNFYAASGGTVPPAAYGYVGGTFTNGMNWVQYLAKDLGVAAPTASINGGSNYAYGGAMTGTGTTSASFLGATLTVPNIGQQISTYLGSNTPAAGQLFTIWGGANDFLNGGQTNYLVPVNNLVSEVETLYAAGARDFLLPNLPPLGSLPGTSGLTAPLPQELNALSAAFNATLSYEMARLQSILSGAQIHILDVNSLFNNISSYGFTNTTDPLVSSGGTGHGYLFWDPIHPTTQADALIGQVGAQSVPEPSSVILFGTALAVLAARELRRRRRVRSGVGQA
jgi:phospholipase/lecithinase/hemolysin